MHAPSLLLPQVFALGVVSVFDQILEALPEQERNDIFNAYIGSLGEEPSVSAGQSVYGLCIYIHGPRSSCQLLRCTHSTSLMLAPLFPPSQTYRKDAEALEKATALVTVDAKLEANSEGSLEVQVSAVSSFWHLGAFSPI